MRQFLLPHKFAELLYILLGFAGKPNHEGSSNGSLGQDRTNLPQKRLDLFAAIGPVHGFQHRIRHMLERDIQIRDNPGIGSHELKKLGVDIK